MFSFGLGLFSVLTMTADQIGSAFYSAMLELLRSDRPPVSNFNYEGPLKLGKFCREALIIISTILTKKSKVKKRTQIVEEYMLIMDEPFINKGIEAFFYYSE